MNPMEHLEPLPNISQTGRKDRVSWDVGSPFVITLTLRLHNSCVSNMSHASNRIMRNRGVGYSEKVLIIWRLPRIRSNCTFLLLAPNIILYDGIFSLLISMSSFFTWMTETTFERSLPANMPVGSC